MPMSNIYPPCDAPPLLTPPWRHDPRFGGPAQARAVLYVDDAIELLFCVPRGRTDVAFCCARPIDYEPGNPEARVVPGLYVALGVPPSEEASYKVWEKGRPPDLVLDVASHSQEPQHDWRAKQPVYARIGIRECWQFDPTGEHFEPRLRGFRLERGRYVALPVVDEGGTATIRSVVLGLDFWLDGAELRVRDPRTGRICPSYEEAVARWRDGYLRAAASAKARREAEARAAAMWKARCEAEAHEAATGKARREAEARAATTWKARCEAEARAATTWKARCEAEAHEAASAKARREAEAREAATAKALREAEAELRAAQQELAQLEAAVQTAESAQAGRRVQAGAGQSARHRGRHEIRLRRTQPTARDGRRSS